MLARNNRIRTRFEFDKVRKFGRQYKSRFFYMCAVRVQEFNGVWDIGEETRVGFIVSNKFDKSAVVRNKVKRRFRECLRANFAQVSRGWWIVFHPRKLSLEAEYAEICADIAKVLQELPVSR